LINPGLGVIIPDMGAIRDSGETDYAAAGSGIADALFTRVQQRVLGILFGQPGRSFYANELVALAETGTGAVFRELKKLEGAGLVTVEQIGRQKHYRANPDSPVFEELRGLVLKTVGLVDVLRSALSPLAEQISLAFVYGSLARQTDTASSDIDLLVISSALTHADLYGVLEAANEQLGRTVNPTVYSPEEFNQRLRDGNAFLSKVIVQPKLWVIGSDHALEA
jgi:predicted nucleotidyltransferase